LYRAQLTISQEWRDADVAQIVTAFDDLAIANSVIRKAHRENNPWLAEWLFSELPDKAELTARLHIHCAVHAAEMPPLPALTIEVVPDENWLELSYEASPPFSIGPFFIYGSHFKGDIPNGQTGLLIDAATAFGSGDHGTTRGCIQAMLELKARGICPWNILDMGTGSGILAIAAWKLWQAPILAVDNDPEAVRVAQKYQKLNGVSDKSGCMECITAEGFSDSAVIARKPYELILANILAAPLIDMAASMRAVCDTPGYVVLSGTLVSQAHDVQSAYEAQGFTLQNRFDIENWSTLVMQLR
jgi:ribosomal protein L11 methyltransferase